MRFERESWRKLFRQEPLEQRAWPLVTRAVRDHLVRYPEELDGYLVRVSQIDRGTIGGHDGGQSGDMMGTVVAALCSALGVHPHERKLVEQALLTLLDDGYLTVDDYGRVSIRNFEDAQMSKDAKKKAKQRARDKGDNRGTLGGTNRGQQGGQSGDIGGDKSGTLARAREDETRRDETRLLPAEPVPQRSDQKITCPAPLIVSDDVLAGLELDHGIPRKVAQANLTAWARQQQSDPSDKRPLGAWVKCAIAAVRGKWSDGSRRPEMRALAEPVIESKPERVKTINDIMAEENRSGGAR